MKVIQCADCGSTNTEYGEYQLVAYRATVLDDDAESAADFQKILWEECRRDTLEGEMEEHFMCNDCFATVKCSSQDANNWKAIEVDNEA